MNFRTHRPIIYFGGTWRQETSAIAEKPLRRHVAGQRAWTLKKGHSRSSKVPPFNSMGMVSYSTSIATMAVSRTVSEIRLLTGQNRPVFSPPLYSAHTLRVKPSEVS